MKGMVEHLLASIDEVEKEIENDIFRAFSPVDNSEMIIESPLF
ncbi:hypothetical protein [Paludibacter sp.]|nr:hypothetical protein [Paludibacter sp.]